MKSAKVLMLFLMLGGLAPAQENEIIYTDKPTQFDLLRKAAESLHTSTRYKPEKWVQSYLTAFLGREYWIHHESLGNTLKAVINTQDRRWLDTPLREYLKVHPGQTKALTEILNLANVAASGWVSGRVIAPEVISRLWPILYREPVALEQIRTESYAMPEALRDWLAEEQILNGRFSSRDTGTLNLARTLNPEYSPVYWILHVEIPIGEADLYKAGKLDAKTAGQLLVVRDGRRYVRYFIHPGSYGHPEIQNLVARYGARVEYLATPTSSARSLAVWNPRAGGPFMLLKPSLTAEVDGRSRIVQRVDAIRAVAATRLLDGAYRGVKSAGRPYLREPLAVFPKGVEFGMLVREAPTGFPSSSGSRFVPALSLMTERMNGELPILVRLIERSRAEPLSFVRERLLRPVVEVYADLLRHQGILSDPNQQDVLVEVNAEGELTGRVKLRDLKNFRIDLEQRSRLKLEMPGIQGAGLRAVRTAIAVRNQGELQSSLGRFAKDWGELLGELRRYYPSINEAQIERQVKELVRERMGSGGSTPIGGPQPEFSMTGWRKARAIAGHEIGGVLKYGAAYVLSEGVNGAIKGDDGTRFLQAVHHVWNVPFAVSMGYFSVAAQTTRTLIGHGLRSRLLHGTPKPLAGLMRAGLPMAFGSAAVDIAHRDFNFRRTVDMTIGMVGSGAVVDFLSGPCLKALGGTLPTGGVKGVACEIIKMAATLQGAGLAAPYIHQGFDEVGRRLPKPRAVPRTRSTKFEDR